ncbi:MAG TPA: C40 family peptidase [Gaiellales bacterium]|nr:C40 family peptidase [Gaiellales bacterium]
MQKQLGQLALKNTQLVEKYDHAQVQVQRREKAATAAARTAAKARADYRAAHTKFTLVIQAQYESGSFGAAGALLDSSSGTNYLDRLETLNVASNQMAQVVKQVSTARTAATDAASAADAALAGAKQQRDAVAKQRKTVQAQIKKYQSLLATLNSAQRAAYQRASNPSVAPSSLMHLTKAGSAAAQRAVQFALAQVGKPYVFGAAGPGAFDCSGLTMAAWQAGGVSLPHSAADQYNYGHHVARSDLQPGDLIFFYQPIGHVTIYIGDGMMVSAPTEGQNVSVVPLSSFNSDYVGATRLT